MVGMVSSCWYQTGSGDMQYRHDVLNGATVGLDDVWVMEANHHSLQHEPNKQLQKVMGILN